jgi:hypothetical protein
MKVFQSMIPMEMHYYYERYRIREGQLIRADEPKLIKFFEDHKNVREIFDEKLKRMAPPLHFIKQPEDPYRMRKEDIIFELRSYGIAVDPYNFSDKLSSQLTLARKMLKRNFITVLNEKNVPIYIDSANLPTPALDKQDDQLPEPEEPNGEFFDIDEVQKPSVIEPKQEKKQQDRIDVTKEIKPFNNKEDEREIAMLMDEIVNTDIEKNKGKIDFEDWILKQYEGQNISKEKDIKELLFVEQKPKIEEHIVEERIREVGIKNEEIVANNFKYLTDTSIKPNKVFVVNEVTEEEKRTIRKINWAKLNIDVLENYLRKQNIRAEYDENNPAKRWDIVSVFKNFYDNAIEKERIAVEINMLQKRHDEITKIEPHYRKSTDLTLKRKATELTKYGLEVWYNKDTNIRKFCQKLYAIAKLGMDVPDTEEAIDQLLRENKRSSVIK